MDGLIEKGEKIKPTFTISEDISNLSFKSTDYFKLYQWLTECYRFIGGTEGELSPICIAFKDTIKDKDRINDKDFEILLGMIYGLKESINEIDEEDEDDDLGF